MRKLRRSFCLVLLLALIPTLPLAAYSVCVTTYVGDCIDYRRCCFYDNVTGEERGCWEIWHTCTF